MNEPRLIPVPRTRRQALRSALAGAAALTLPLGLRPTGARAAGPNDCRKGCLWTAGRHFAATKNRCHVVFGQYLMLLLYNPPYAALGSLTALHCIDRAVLEHKAASFDCTQPNCPGFDPRAAGGPCDSCGDNCCTCQASVNGYICCVFSCNDTEHNCCPE